MKRLAPLFLAIAFILCLVGSASATTLFWDEVLPGGNYTFTTATRTMVLNVQTVYTPYSSGDGTWSSGGTGTTIDWTFTAIFDSSIDQIVDGGWEEYWGSRFRVGFFDDGTASYVRTGTNDLGQNTGTFSAEWSSVNDTNVGPLSPPAPWYAILDLTRVSFGGTPYSSSGTVTGYVGNDPPAPVPEPSTMLLLGSGLIGLAWYGRKRKQA